MNECYVKGSNGVGEWESNCEMLLHLFLISFGDIISKIIDICC